MAVPDDRLQQIIEGKDEDAAQKAVSEHRYVEAWRILDSPGGGGCLVIFDRNDPPEWLVPVIEVEDARQEATRPQVAA